MKLKITNPILANYFKETWIYRTISGIEHVIIDEYDLNFIKIFKR